MSGFLSVKDRQLVLSDDESKIVKLKGANFQTPYHPHFFFKEFDWDWVKRGMEQVEGLGMNCVRQIVRSSLQDYVQVFGQYLNIAEQHGVRAYVILGWPHLYADEGTPEDRENLEYMRNLVESVKDDPRVLAWDLTNEPDWVSHQAWEWTMDIPAATKRMHWFKRMIDEIKEIDPNHPISCGTNFCYTQWSPEVPFSLESIVDFVDFHYYRRNNRSYWLDERIRQMKEHTTKPILIGEFGFPTYPDFHIHGEPEHNEELQVEYYRHYITDIAKEDISGFVQWALTDCVPGNADEPDEGTYGIVRMDLSWKPAAEMIRDIYQATKW